MNSFLLPLVALLACASADVHHRIIGGSNAAAGAWPWQLSLRQSSSHICGASILSTTKGVTAAHCVTGSGYAIRAGTTTRSTCSGNCQDRTVTSLVVHPNYGSGTGAYPNDVATLRWSALSYNSEIAAITMSTTDTGSGCYITGWGRTSASGSLPENLQQAPTNIITNTACTSYWGTNINAGHICVYTGSTGACNGDSGGPMVCQVSGSWRLYGATSWGATGCSVSYPSVYTKISYFYNWINAN